MRKRWRCARALRQSYARSSCASSMPSAIFACTLSAQPRIRTSVRSAPLTSRHPARVRHQVLHEWALPVLHEVVLEGNRGVSKRAARFVDDALYRRRWGSTVLPMWLQASKARKMRRATAAYVKAANPRLAALRRRDSPQPLPRRGATFDPKAAEKSLVPVHVAVSRTRYLPAIAQWHVSNSA